MKKLRLLVLAAVFMLSSLIGGCMFRVDATKGSLDACSKKEKEQFAEIVAKKVVELQREEWQKRREARHN